MESTGVSQRIQVSEDTAQALIAHGKGSWLTTRDDQVVAKGKGAMTTYFCVVPAGTHVTCSTDEQNNSSPHVTCSTDEQNNTSSEDGSVTA